MKGLPALLSVVLLGRLSVALADPMPERSETSIVLHPAPEPIPALKYRLVPEVRTLAPGNAAVFYHRAVQLVIETRIRLAPRSATRRGRRPAGRIAVWRLDERADRRDTP